LAPFTGLLLEMRVENRTDLDDGFLALFDGSHKVADALRSEKALRRHSREESDDQVAEHPRQPEEAVSEAATQSREERPDWFPKEASTREEWRDAYKCICEKRSERDTDWKTTELRTRKLTLRDYSDHLFDALELDRCTKWVSHVIKAGDAGWLEE
jgi:hypothetical protein